MGVLTGNRTFEPRLVMCNSKILQFWIMSHMTECKNLSALVHTIQKDKGSNYLPSPIQKEKSFQ